MTTRIAPPTFVPGAARAASMLIVYALAAAGAVAPTVAHAGATRRVSVDSAGVQANGGSSFPALDRTG
ncbi:hypothetical protein K2Z84_20915 [Candidatus Binatia bacterium]|jgi:hypothetical protein|nr:hypothetical protein [Candidatus Binatia bacterium]